MSTSGTLLKYNPGPREHLTVKHQRKKKKGALRALFHYLGQLILKRKQELIFKKGFLFFFTKRYTFKRFDHLIESFDHLIDLQSEGLYPSVLVIYS